MPKLPSHQLARRAEAQRRYWAKQPPGARAATARRSNLWRRYRITPEQFDEMLEHQGYRCAICRSPDPHHRYGWRVDHNHKSGKVRGILCNPCNIAVGMTREDPVQLLQIAMYLREHDG